MRKPLLILPLFLALNLCFAQEQNDARTNHWPTGCEEGAVEVNLSRAPAMDFRKLSEAPIVSFDDPAKEFRFSSGTPFTKVQLFFTATVATGPQYGADSHAKLSVFVRTEPGDAGDTSSTWWELVPNASNKAARTDTIFQELITDSTEIAKCFQQPTSSDGIQCTPASAALASDDPNVALVGISFSQDLGGANARNWTNSDILLDFRSSPPKVLAGVDCSYNEGGGACTALDSGQMTRYDLSCNFSQQVHDFLCTQKTDTSYRDFYLLDDKQSPLRTEELDSLSAALAVLRANKNATQIVRGLGPVRLIDEVSLLMTKVAILGGPIARPWGGASGETFHFVCESPACVSTSIFPHGLEEQSASEQQTGDIWTANEKVTFSVKRIVEDKRLVVDEVVANKSGVHSIYWLGVERAAHPVFDALMIATEDMDYAGCGRYDSGYNVISAVIRKPFRATATVQPPFRNDQETAVWKPSMDSDVEPTNDCNRKGEIDWVSGKGFHVDIADKGCSRPQAPKFVVINDQGKISLSDTQQPAF